MNLDVSASSAHVGDCRALLARLPEGCVQTCVTSPPYWGLRDYGVDGQLGLERTPEEYVAAMVEVFRGVRRALRDDGTLWLNLGDTYAGSRAGDQGNGGAMADRSVSKQRCRNADRIADGLKPKDLVGIPWLVAFALRADGWYLRSEIIWHKPNPMPESVTDRPTKAHEHVFLFAKSARYFYDASAIAEPAIGDHHRNARDPYASAVPDGSPHRGLRQQETGSDTRNKRDVWTIATEPFEGAHFAVMPPSLVEPCILAGSRAGDLVLDPFFGSGTTGMVAEKHGRRWVGFDINPAYSKISDERTAQRSLLGRMVP